MRALPEVKAVADLHGFMGRGELTDEQWAVLEPLLPQGRKVGRPPVWPRQQLIDGIRDKLSVRYEATVLVAAINEWLRPALSHQS
ncbi:MULTISPECIES: transposase [Streptomyces]|uniref:transposase n=1 Tax=Streptomyces sp. STCH 565 A TaxID=2950532 RepID=UPI001CCE0EA6|nr:MULTISPECIES: transposase [Streptomyces]MCM8555066.1 transposase [Streptomyces sp. STCH 565 A]